jgi:hypothetical protein
MVENTIGKLWLDYQNDDVLKEGLHYLVEDSTQAFVTRKDKLSFDSIEELTLIDPACGSGHILVEAFDVLFDMYFNEGYDNRESARKILTFNLFGLDIDERAAQLARFAVLMKAAQKADKSLLDGSVMPHILAMPEAHIFHKEDIETVLGTEGNCWWR